MIRCISPYKSSLGKFVPGDTIDGEALGKALMIDSPGSFEVVAPEAPEPKAKVVTKPAKAEIRKVAGDG